MKQSQLDKFAEQARTDWKLLNFLCTYTMFEDAYIAFKGWNLHGYKEEGQFTLHFESIITTMFRDKRNKPYPSNFVEVWQGTNPVGEYNLATGEWTDLFVEIEND